MQQKHDYCQFCATETTVYQLSDGSWACKTVTNLTLPNFTCYGRWEKMLTVPLKFKISDFYYDREQEGNLSWLRCRDLLGRSPL
jgi:hypothetical protein